MGSLKSFITSVRKAKTIADERSVIRKESASIRSAIRDVSIDERTRRTLISKLIYLYILGEPTHFGQVECLKLLATQSFTSKRLGYLATMLLLDENQEVLTLLTNSLDNDLQHPNYLFINLALVTLGNIASTELARDLYNNVLKLIHSPNTYLKKKAILVSAKLIEKDPDLTEFFIELIPGFLNDSSHGELLAALQLIKVCYRDETNRPFLRQQVPRLVHWLNQVQVPGPQEYAVAGQSDPFLCVSLLQALRLLLKDNDTDIETEYADQLADLLTKLLSKANSSHNAANSIRYEVVRTIFDIQSDSSLKVLGVNVLGAFLTSKDNNARYVSLNTLLTVIHYEPKAVQRHRSTIVSCLRDPDISIRRRALELSFAILDKNNIRGMIKELIAFLDNAETDLKPYLTTQLTLAIEQYFPDEKWQFETLISILKSAGNFFEFDIISSILAMIMRTTDQGLIKWLVHQLYEESDKHRNQFALNLVFCWCLGEYGEYIDKQEQAVDLLQMLLIESHYEDKSNTEQIVKYGLMTCLKLSCKLQAYPALVERLRQLIQCKSNDINLEIQIRAVEYGEIFVQPIEIKKGLLEKMPAPPFKSHKGISLSNGASSAAPASAKSKKKDEVPDLLDLLGDDTPQQSAPQPSTAQTLDLISDLFGTSSTPATTPAPVAVPAVVDPISTMVSPLDSGISYVEAFRDANVTVSFGIKSHESGQVVLESMITNTTTSIVSQVSMLIAVTKSLKLQLSPLTNSTISVNGSVFQQLNISGKPGAKIKLRVKLAYQVNGSQVDTQFDFGKFVQTL